MSGYQNTQELVMDLMNGQKWKPKIPRTFERQIEQCLKSNITKQVIYYEKYKYS